MTTIDPAYKVLYARILRLETSAYLRSKRFDRLLIEKDADRFWQDCFRLARRRSGIIRSADFEAALGAFIELGFKQRGQFGELLADVLADLDGDTTHGKRDSSLFAEVATALADLEVDETVCDRVRRLGSGTSTGAALTEIPTPTQGCSTPESPPVENSSSRPRLFIGSSTEGLRFAEALQVNLDHDAETTLWSQGVFGLSTGNLEALVRIATQFEFAALVLTPDDLVESRGREMNSARDNVLFELGLFMGALGRDRTFIVHPRDQQLDLPSDLAGVTAATFVSQRSDGNLQAALGAVATQIKQAILGVRAAESSG